MGLKYAVIGGVAVNLHGYNRVTGDLDIVLLLTDEEISKFIKIVKQLGLVPRLPVKLEDFANKAKRMEWITEKNMKVFSVYHPEFPLEHIDVLIDGEDKIGALIKNSIPIKAGLVLVNLVHLDDLIQLKKEAARDRDLIDVKALEKIREHLETKKQK